MNHLAIYKKINQLPVNLITEVEDYIDFLLQKHQNVQLPKISKAESLPKEQSQPIVVQNIPPDLANELIAEKRQEIKSVQAKPLIMQRQQDILKNIKAVWDEEDVKAVEQVQQEINQWKIQTF